MFENILTKESVTFKDLEEIAFKNLIPVLKQIWNLLLQLNDE